ncbi:MAG: HlyD family efflux transporter periplasmic adaptor subunit [Pseudomonadota bacterium]
MSLASLDEQFQDQMHGPARLIHIVTGAVVVFVLWAALAWVDEIVRGHGALVSSSRPQIIQNLEGGILAELAVSEGAVVEAGDILARLRGTQFQSQADDLQDQITALTVRKLRLEAELAGQFDFDVPEALQARMPGVVASERALLMARQTDFVSRREGAERVLDQAAQEKELLENLLDREIVALIEVTRARKIYADARGKLDEIITRTELERAQSHSDTLKELGTLRQGFKAAQDQLNRTVLVSPVRGVVNNLAVTTIGGVVRPGEEILRIIPLGEELFVEAQIRPEDIAGVKPGQEATIKLSAYDYTIYGALKGAVTLVSADTFKDERKEGGDPHYKVTVAVDRGGLTERQKRIAMRPGMLAEVELHTGSKTVLSYLLKPLYKSRDAFREP